MASLIKGILNVEGSYKAPKMNNYTKIRLGDLVTMDFNPSTQRVTVQHKNSSSFQNDMLKLDSSPKSAKGGSS